MLGVILILLEHLKHESVLQYAALKERRTRYRLAKAELIDIIKNKQVPKCDGAFVRNNVNRTQLLFVLLQ